MGPITADKTGILRRRKRKEKKRSNRKGEKKNKDENTGTGGEKKTHQHTQERKIKEEKAETETKKKAILEMDEWSFTGNWTSVDLHCTPPLVAVVHTIATGIKLRQCLPALTGLE